MTKSDLRTLVFLACRVGAVLVLYLSPYSLKLLDLRYYKCTVNDEECYNWLRGGIRLRTGAVWPFA